MSAISPIIHLQPPADAAADSPSSRSDADNGPSAFSKALSGTQDRPPPRKSAARHRSDDSGANLPASGNASPTAATPPPPAAPAAEVNQASPAPRNVTASAAAAPAAAAPAPSPGPAAAATPDPAATDPAAAKKAAADAAAAAAQAAAVALPDATAAAADPATVAAPPAPVVATVKAVAPAGAPLTPAPTAAVAKSVASTAAASTVAATASAAAKGTSPATPANAPDATAGTADPAVAATPAASGAPPAADPAVAALLAQATTPSTDAGKPSDGRVVDATLQAPDSQAPLLGDSAGLAGAGAAAPAFAATLAGTAEIASAVAGTSADKHDKSTPDALATDALAAAGQQGPASTAQTDAAAPLLKVPSTVDSPDFAQNVANQVSVMVDSKLSSAKLQVSPPSLGPIEVRIAIQGDHAQVFFSSHSALTRDALESSSPHLREMLGAQGFAQVSVDISHRSFQERTPTPPSYDWSVGSERTAGGSGVSVAASVARSNNGLLDAYA